MIRVLHRCDRNGRILPAIDRDVGGRRGHFLSPVRDPVESSEAHNYAALCPAYVRFWAIVFQLYRLIDLLDVTMITVFQQICLVVSVAEGDEIPAERWMTAPGRISGAARNAVDDTKARR